MSTGSLRRAAHPSLLPIALLLWASVAAGAAEKGLVADYNFNEGSGSVARDSSGHGFDARIHGATYVRSPRGYALHFDGVKDYVDCGAPAGMKIAGDLTIEAWVKAEALDGRNRLIFGDVAGYTINRNYNLRLDRGELRFEYGNNTDYGVMLFDGVPPLDQWCYLAMVCEYPHYFLYVNGKEAHWGEMGLPISPTKGGPWHIGGWFAGHFKGDIDEVRVYRRALSDSEIASHYAGAAVAPRVWTELAPSLHYSRGEVAASLLCGGLQTSRAVADFALRGPGARAVATGSAELRETRPGSQRWLGATTLSTAGLTGGNSWLSVSVKGPGGQRLCRANADVPYPDHPPVWFHSRAGINDEVPAPWTDLEAQQVPEGFKISPWGREYRFAPDSLIAQITSRDKPMLAAPVRLIAVAAGRPVAWRPAPPHLVTRRADHCELTQSLSGGDLAVEVNTGLDFDGFVKMNLSLTTRHSQTLDKLTFAIPLNAACARYLYTWPKIHSGTLKQNYASAFQPIVWLGDEEKGLSWVCESNQYWHPADLDQAITVDKGDKVVTLRLNLISTPTVLAAGQQFNYTFGLQATPVKPMTQDVWDYRIVRNAWYGYDLDVPNKKVDGEPALQYYADKGARAMLISRWWDAFAYTSPLGHEQQFRNLVKACHAVGIKVMPYVGGFLLSERAPEAPYFKAEMTRVPVTDFPLHMPGLPPQTGWIVCQKSSWQDFLVDGIARLIDNYDVDGVYLDSTTIPWACRNMLHGCGYRDQHGQWHSTYPVFAVRRDLERIYKVVKARKPHGIIDVHVFDCMNSPALSFATCYWNGEQLRRGVPFKLDDLPLDRFRTEFMGYNWGVPADLLYYVMGNYRACTGLALLHNVPCQSEKLSQLDLQSSIWRLRDQFGCKQAQWLPYWHNADYVTVSPANCYVSLYRHPSHGVLACVVNYTRGEATVAVKLAAAKLGLTGKLTASDGLTKAPVAVEGSTFKLKLPSQGWELVWVRSQS